MARLEDLIASVKDAQLRDALRDEVKELKNRTRFGLVYERHLPETLCLGVNGGLRTGDQVRLRKQPDDEAIFRVKSVRGAKATIVDEAGNALKASTADLLAIKRFGEPIYPTLTSVGKIERSENRPYHAVINGENYHTLQLLLHTCEGQVDCIYIDPPYNTGARDWKYNNRYVDDNDAWRHSKWLSFMEKRLRLAKRLLKPDGVLIVTIDEHEERHLSMLLEQLLPEYLRYMVTIVISARGNFKANFSRVEEYAIFCCPDIGHDVVTGAPVDYLPDADDIDEDQYQDEDDIPLTPEEAPGFVTAEENEFEFRHARRRGPDSERAARPSMFYPLYINERDRVVVRAGRAPAPDKPPNMAHIDGLRPVWPIDTKGAERRWRWGRNRMQEAIKAGDVVLGKYNKKRDTWTVNLRIPKTYTKNIKTVWRTPTHDAGTYGTSLLEQFLGDSRAFNFPKSLYATRDALAAVCRNRPDALILDFFAGSGTTLHATCLLNDADGGRRRCILVTNNEVDEKKANQLFEGGHVVGDSEFERHGIFESVARPRIEAAITGRRPDRKPVEGSYLDGRAFADGFEENCEFFRLDYLDPDKVELGRSFDALHPLFWLRAGARSARPKKLRSKSGFALVKDAGYAVLFDESTMPELTAAINAEDDITHVFLQTNSEDAYAEMCELLDRDVFTVQLYADYLGEFSRGVNLVP